MVELLITSSVDPIEEGQSFRRLPRHVPVWQNFTLPDVYLGAFARDVGHVVEGFTPLEVIGMDDTFVGPENTTVARRVMAVGAGATLITLHTLIGGLIDRYDGDVHAPEQAYERFDPHMEYIHGSALQVAEYARLKAVHLVEDQQTTGLKVIRKQWELEES